MYGLGAVGKGRDITARAKSLEALPTTSTRRIQDNASTGEAGLASSQPHASAQQNKPHRHPNEAAVTAIFEQPSNQHSTSPSLTRTHTAEADRPPNKPQLHNSHSPANPNYVSTQFQTAHNPPQTFFKTTEIPAHWYWLQCSNECGGTSSTTSEQIL
eukprot:g39704.t1